MWTSFFSVIYGIIFIGVDSALYLKKINFQDVEEEYKAIKSMPAQENGFENKYHDVTKDEFINEVIPKLLKNSEGLDLPDGYVPDTYLFLWDNDKIIGLFKIRHYLNDFLRKGPGHIGYGILPEYRGKGYAKKGLILAIEKCKEIVKEDEVYLSVRKDNPTSLRVQLSCGAFIVGETEDYYLTRINLKENHIKYKYFRVFLFFKNTIKILLCTYNYIKNTNFYITKYYFYIDYNNYS